MAAVIIFRTGGIGDVILSTVAINILADAAPGADIHWFGYPSTTVFIRQAFPFVHTHDMKKSGSYRENIDIVKKAVNNADLVIDLQRSARTMIIGKIAARHFHCPCITWNKYSVHRTLLVLQSRIRGRWSDTDLLKRPLPNRYAAMAGCVSRGLVRIGIPAGRLFAGYKPEIKPAEQRSGNAVAINMGALYRSKELPFYKLNEIVSHLLSHGIETIYLLGDERKYADGELLIRAAGGEGTFENLCGKTTLWQAAKILAKCALSVGNDSALAHLSESVGTPVLVFFGPTHEKFGYRPHLASSKSFSTELSCRPCTKGGNTKCRYGDLKCLHDIPLTPAFDHLSILLSPAK